MLPIFDFRMTLKSQLFSYCAYFNFDETICNEIVSYGENLFQFLLPSLKAPNLINAENYCEILIEFQGFILPRNKNRFYNKSNFKRILNVSFSM
jgi:hypothetical protein